MEEKQVNLAINVAKILGDEEYCSLVRTMLKQGIITNLQYLQLVGILKIVHDEEKETI